MIHVCAIPYQYLQHFKTKYCDPYFAGLENQEMVAGCGLPVEDILKHMAEEQGRIVRCAEMARTERSSREYADGLKDQN